MKKLLITLCLLANTGFALCAEPVEPYESSTEAKLQYNQGVDYYKIGQYDRAMASFRQAINIDPNYIDAYFNLGSILEYLKQDDAALAVFKQIIVRKPDDYESVYKAANLSNKLGQPDKAKTYLALIPPESSIYTKAKTLLDSLTPAEPQKAAENSDTAPGQEPKSSLEPVNHVYNNIVSPTGITTDSAGNIFVAAFADNIIYKINPAGNKVIFIKDAKINGPIGMVSDDVGNIYVSNYNNNNVVKITPQGVISVLISNIQKPYGLHINGNILFVSLQGSNSVLKYKL